MRSDPPRLVEERKPLPPTPSPQRRGGEEETCLACPPSPRRGGGLGGGVLKPLLNRSLRSLSERRTLAVARLAKRCSAAGRDHWPFRVVPTIQEAISLVEEPLCHGIRLIIGRDSP